MADKIEVRNVNVPDQVTRVDAAKYRAMETAMMAVMDDAPPGQTAKEIVAAVKPHLPEDLFPGGATSGWWQKCVQLDLEARGVLARSDRSPLRFWKLDAH